MQALFRIPTPILKLLSLFYVELKISQTQSKPIAKKPIQFKLNSFIAEIIIGIAFYLEPEAVQLRIVILEHTENRAVQFYFDLKSFRLVDTELCSLVRRTTQNVFWVLDSLTTTFKCTTAKTEVASE